MIPVGNHGLGCLDDEDYAAIALYMQGQGLIIDTALSQISNSLDTFYLRPSVVAQTTGVAGPASSGGEQLFGLSGNWALTYSNFTPVTISSGVRITIPRTGWYTYGCYGNLQTTGAVTALSRRTLYARATRQTVGVSAQLSQAVFRTVDTNTGGEFLVASSASFYATEETVVDIEGYWSHTNAASLVQVNSGARLWCHFDGSGIEIGST